MSRKAKRRRSSYSLRWRILREKRIAARKAKPFSWMGYRFKTAEEKKAFQRVSERREEKRARRHLERSLTRQIFVGLMVREIECVRLHPPVRTQDAFRAARAAAAAFVAHLPKADVLEDRR